MKPVKLVKTIEQEHGVLKVTIFRIDGEIAHDTVFTPIKNQGETYTTEIHNNGSPMVNHEIIIAIDEFHEIEKDFKGSGIESHDYCQGLTARIHAAKKPTSHAQTTNF